MKLRLYFLLCILFIPFLLIAQDVDLQFFASGFNKPVDIRAANDSRLFIVEQDGVVKILNANGTTNATPFLDISSRVRSIGNEQGLLSIAFHPNYTTNGKFYIHYSDNSGNTKIAQLNVTSNPDVADSSAANENTIYTATQPYSNHNGGSIAFGQDGYLYIALGDGGSGGDPQNLSQNLMSPLGKILRLDVDNGTPYSIPATNPFVGNPNVLDEIWAYGMRNPWRISFDRQDGDLWIGDVGQSAKEEIDMVSIASGGYNFGWRCYEGNSTFNLSGCPSSSSMTFPVAEYAYGGSPFRCSITGGYRYRGTQYPDFQGLYFFADYCSNEVGTLTQVGNSWNITYNGPFSGNISTFGEDINGELYAAGLSNGTIYKVIDTTLGLEENTLTTKYSIYPNPANSYFQVKNLQPSFLLNTLNIRSVSGKLIKRISNPHENQKINIASFQSGLYILELISDNDVVSYHKLVKN